MVPCLHLCSKEHGAHQILVGNLRENKTLAGGRRRKVLLLHTRTQATVAPGTLDILGGGVFFFVQAFPVLALLGVGK